MNATIDTQTPGIYLSVPTADNGEPIAAKIAHDRIAYADLLKSDVYEDAVYVGMETFVELGYGDRDTVYATLYQIGEAGRFDWSVCLPIDGPEAE